MKTAKEILYEAARIVEKGWCQYESRKGNKYCAIGAIDKAAGGSGADELVFAAKRRLGIEHLSVWNDAPERTQGEVVLALGFAAEMAGSENE